MSNQDAPKTITRWVDDHATTIPEAEQATTAWTLAANLEADAEENSFNSSTPHGTVVAIALREYAAKVRDSGCTTAEQWLARIGS